MRVDAAYEVDYGVIIGRNRCVFQEGVYTVAHTAIYMMIDVVICESIHRGLGRWGLARYHVKRDYKAL